jgi:hypothetical protein
MAGANSMHFAINSLLSAFLHRVLPKIALAVDGKGAFFKKKGIRIPKSKTKN